MKGIRLNPDLRASWVNPRIAFKKRILKRYRVTPVSSSLLLAVQTAIYAIYSLLSLGLVYLVSAVFFGVRLSGSWGLFFAAFLLVMPSVLQKAADLLPLTQGIKLLKAASLGQPPDIVWTPFVILIGLIIICGGLAVKFFKWE